MSIHINNLTFSHDDSSLLHDLSFSVEKNQIGFVSGSSGIGKSSLFNIIAGLILPENGKIMLDDILFNDKNFSLETEKRKIGYVFQDFALFPHINVKRNIQYAMSSKENELFDELISKLGLLEFLDKMPHELSGGQQQRAALLRAILMKPKILLLDEPFSNLDKDNIIAAQKIISQIISLFDIPCLLISHDIQSSENFQVDKEIIIS
jgi:ABC-type molybdate transport system ATPase subunit